jgi:hypothetical protein
MIEVLLVTPEAKTPERQSGSLEAYGPPKQDFYDAAPPSLDDRESNAKHAKGAKISWFEPRGTARLQSRYLAKSVRTTPNLPLPVND